jgi:hypothetical protein
LQAAARAVAMVGMEGSAVLAVSKVVVVVRAERAGAGSARVVCADGGSAGCGREGCDRDLRHPANVLASFCSKKDRELAILK